jgi:RNA polymerase sigma-70 factor, ECF subfamily
VTRNMRQGKTINRFSQFATMNDSELVEMTSKGSPEAFQVLADRYEALVKSIAAKFLEKDSMAVEDVCQETFLRAVVRLGDLRDTSRFKSWICVIARNQALDEARKRGLTVSLAVEDDEGGSVTWEIADLKANPAELQFKAEIEAIVKDVLDDIPEMYKRPITLRYEEGLDYGEIAKTLEKPLGTIKSLIHRGKHLMKEELTRRAWSAEGAHALVG